MTADNRKASRRRLGALSSFAAGLFSAAGFGLDHELGVVQEILWLTPIIALAILLLAIWDAQPRMAALWSFCFGLGHFGGGVGWTYKSLADYAGLPLIGALAVAGSLVFLLSLFYAAAGWLGRRIYRGSDVIPSLTRIGAAWVLFEFVRSWLFGGFGWLAAGYSQVPYSPLAGVIPLFGTLGATFACLYCASLIVFLVANPSRHTNSVAVGTAAGITAVGYLLVLVNFSWPAGKPFAASVLQASVPQSQQWLRENMTTLPSLYLELARQSQGKLIVAPESALPFAWKSLPEKLRKEYDVFLSSRNSTLVLGAFTSSPDDERAENSAVVFDGENEWSYAKRHLTPYGEYLPFAALLEPLLKRAQIPYANLASGNGSSIIELDFVTLGMSICYESLFPELFQVPPAQLLVNITNDSWFDGTRMPYQHLQIASARALEYQRWLVRASNTGPSAIIAPSGKVAAMLPWQEEGSLTHEVVPLDGYTLYSLWGSYPVVLGSLYLLVRHLRKSRRKKQAV